MYVQYCTVLPRILDIKMILYNAKCTIKKMYSKIEKLIIRNKIRSAKMIVVHFVHENAHSIL